MPVGSDISFNQLVKIARKLPVKQWTRLKAEVEKTGASHKPASNLEALLLNAPTFSKKQIDAIAQTRKAINQWRTK